MTTPSENDDPLSVVLGPTDMSDIDSALEDLLNGGDIGTSSHDDFAIGDDDDDDELNVEDVPLESDDAEKEKTNITNDSSNIVAPPAPAASVMTHPLAAFSSAPTPATATASTSTSTSTSMPGSNSNSSNNLKTTFATNSTSAIDTMKSLQASVPSMSSVTSSITQLWNQSKPQFGPIPSVGSNTSSISPPSTTSYNVRSTSAFPQNTVTPSHTTSAITTPNTTANTANSNDAFTSQPPPNVPNTSSGISSLLLSHIDSLYQGERIVMLLSHIKRVSQSSFPLASREGKWWCCAVTLYRIILFPYNDEHGIAENTTKRYMGGGEWILEKEREAKGLLIQMPLSTIDRIEKIDEDQQGLPSNPLSSNGQNFALVLHG